MNRGGIFALSTVDDLFAKARRDLDRLRNDPADSYAAFDFFVTARHIPDWLYPNDKAKIEHLFRDNYELRLCRHIADQGKHFEVTAFMHAQVADTQTGGRLEVVMDWKDPEMQFLGDRRDALEFAELAYQLLEVILLYRK